MFKKANLLCLNKCVYEILHIEGCYDMKYSLLTGTFDNTILRIRKILMIEKLDKKQ